MHESPWRCTPCRYQLHVRIYACTTSTAFTLAPCWHQIRMHRISNQIRMHHINSLQSCSFTSAINNCKPTLPPLPFFVLPFSHNHPLPSLVTIGSFFLGFAFPSLNIHYRNKLTGHRGAWHFRLEEAQKLSSHACPISIRKELSKGQRPMASKWRSQAGHWQTFPGRELASVPGRDCKHAQAGHAHWQAVSRQGTGKRSRQGLQTCPGRVLANVPRQGTVDVPRQGTVVVPRQGTLDIAKEHCANKFSIDLPPTPEVPLHRQPAACCVMILHAWLRDEGL